MGDLTDEMAEADYHGRVDERIAALEAENAVLRKGREKDLLDMTQLLEAVRATRIENMKLRTMLDSFANLLAAQRIRRAPELLAATEPREGNGA